MICPIMTTPLLAGKVLVGGTIPPQEQAVIHTEQVHCFQRNCAMWVVFEDTDGKRKSGCGIVYGPGELL